MADDEHRLAGEPGRGLGEPGGDPFYNLLITLSVWKRRRRVSRTPFIDFLHRMPGESPVAALTQPGVAHDRQRAISKGDLGGAKRTHEIRTEHHREVIVSTTRSEAAGLFLAFR